MKKKTKKAFFHLRLELKIVYLKKKNNQHPKPKPLNCEIIWAWKMKKNSQYVFTKFHSLGSCNSFWNFKLYFWCSCLKYRFMFLCGKHNSNCVHIYAFFHWKFSANNALCQDKVKLPEGSAPGTLKPLMIKPQACCVPCSTRIGLSSYSLPHRVYHKFSTPVKQTAWRSWARWPIQKSRNIFRKSSTRGLLISFFLF